MSPNQSDWPPEGSIRRAERDIEKLQESLDRIEQKVDRLFVMEAYVNEHERMLCGTNGEPGMRIRLDRVEQVIERHKTYLGLMAAATVGIVADLLRKLIGTAA